MADRQSNDEARRSRRVAGPFEGYRLGATDVPVRVRDFSLHGCLVELSFGTIGHQVVTLQIDLPVESWTVVQCEMIHAAGHNAFAVKFIRLNEETRRRIERTIDRLLDRRPEDEAPVINGEANDE
jgi:PilZ domain